jgi:hypothetical protein
LRLAYTDGAADKKAATPQRVLLQSQWPQYTHEHGSFDVISS